MTEYEQLIEKFKKLANDTEFTKKEIIIKAKDLLMATRYYDSQQISAKIAEDLKGYVAARYGVRF